MNKWDQRYQSDAYLYGTQPNDFLRERVNHIPKGRVLSLAEGEGRNAVYLALQGHEVTAVDASSVGLEKARQLAGKHRVKVNWIQSNLGDFDLGAAQWDAIVSIFCHIAPDQRRALH
ncbi:MAG: class I SAM-dependent methyltransferase, partial [Desulfobacterales bacterium]|nr:class I SAM-dependent methyltransferase [Desulfobacterales bacterium]